MTAGSLSIAIEKCRSVLAATVAVQEWLGIDPDDSDADEQALERIHLHRLPEPDGDVASESEEADLVPYALLGPAEADAVDMSLRAFDAPRLGGAFDLILAQAEPTVDSNGTAIDTAEQADAAWFDTIGKILEGFVDQAVTDGFPLRGGQRAVRLSYGPWRPSEMEEPVRGVRMAAILTIEWGAA